MKPLRLSPFLVSIPLAAVLLGGGTARAATSVACVGDSITELSGWPGKLGTKLGASYAVTNFGLSGTTLLKKGDHPYWTSAQYTQSHAANPAIVVIMLGTNDSKPFNWDAHKGEFVGDYEALIDTYAALPSSPKIYLNLCPPAGTNGFNISGAVIENEINPLIRQIAASKGVGLIDVFTAFGGHAFDPALFGSAGDQVHPGAAGAQRIADTVYAALVAPSADGGVADGGKDATGADVGGADAKPGDAAAEKAAPPDATGAAGSGGAAGAGGTGAAGAGSAGTGGGGTNGGTGAAGTSAAAGTGGGAAGAGGLPPAELGQGCGCALGAAAHSTGLGLAALLAALVLARRRGMIRRE